MIPPPDFESFLYASPYPYLLLNRDYVIVGANRAFLAVTRREHNELIGKHIFDAFPDDPEDPGSGGVSSSARVRASLDRVAQNRSSDSIALLRYPIPHQTESGVRFEERFWSAIHTPILDEHGELAYISQNATDVTELYRGNFLRMRAGGSVTGTRHPCPTLPEDITSFNRTQALIAINHLLDTERNHLRQLFEQAPGFVSIVRGSGHMLEMANKAWYELIGEREILGKTIQEALPELVGQGLIGLLDQVYASGRAYVDHEKRIFLHRDSAGTATEAYVDFVLQPLTLPDGSAFGIFIQGHDVTEKKRNRDELHVSNERLKLAVEGVGDGVWDMLLPEKKVAFSDQLKEILGYKPNEFPDAIEEWEKRIHPDDLPGMRAALEAYQNDELPLYQVEYRIACKNGTWKWVLSRGKVVERDAEGRPRHITGIVSDISDKKESEELIWHHANFDTLTHLPNRRLFHDRLDHELRRAHRSNHYLALLYVDLDRFKEVNDLLGHNTGDFLLQQAANRLRECVRESDTVARIGGDEFTIIINEIDHVTHVEHVARNILAALLRPFNLGNDVAYLSASIGITMYPTDGISPAELIMNADQAMYVAKNAGKNQFRRFTRSMQEKVHTRLRLGGDLRNALKENQFEVYYQPVIDLGNNRIVKAEALLRWHHPLLGDVDPARFIPLAEESGMINKIGDWVFKEAVGCSQRWSQQLGVPFQVSVNKSPAQFRTKAGDINWLSYLQGIGFAGSGISVEITEGLMLNMSSGVANKLLAYRDAGIQVALDDFGTGYSSMAYLKKFDIDYLKIDQSFVRDVVNDEGTRTIVKSMILMAHELGLKVIAEGIETIGQKEFLIKAGCDFGQGFLFSKAEPPGKFELMLAA